MYFTKNDLLTKFKLEQLASIHVCLILALSVYITSFADVCLAVTIKSQGLHSQSFHIPRLHVVSLCGKLIQTK